MAFLVIKIQIQIKVFSTHNWTLTMQVIKAAARICSYPQFKTEKESSFVEVKLWLQNKDG